VLPAALAAAGDGSADDMDDVENVDAGDNKASVVADCFVGEFVV
jgi:hypothetical protein